MRKLTPAESAALADVSRELGVKPRTFAALIEFESRWNAIIKNPTSSARGLIQFMTSTARDMGYQDSEDLVLQYPTAEAQLRGPVLDYLRPMAPFRDKPPRLDGQSLFMAVFYPAARRWNPDRPFPQRVQAANPGIVTVRDYVEHVWRRAGDVVI